MHHHQPRPRVRMMSTMIRSCVVALLLAVGAAQAADIGISPARLELTARPGDTVGAAVTVLKNAGAEQQVATEVNDWTLDPMGEVSYREPGSVDHSASAWLDLDNPEFLLAAGSAQQEVRIDLTLPDDPSLSGTYHTVVFFSVVTPPADGVGPVGVTTTTRVGLTVYVTIAGTEQPATEIVDFFDMSDRTLSLVVANDGNTLFRLDGTIELRDENGDLVHALSVPKVPVMRGSERDVRVEIPEEVEPGFYVILALLDDGRGDLLVGELLLDVP
jgi:hypothetical protein